MTGHHNTDTIPPDGWKNNGVRVIPGHPRYQHAADARHEPGRRDQQGPRRGGEDLGRHRHIHANAKTGAHHHGELESIIYVVKGSARMRWGDKLEYVAEAGPGDFIFVPPYVPHQEINASRTRRWNACWCAPTRRRWWSTSTSSRWRRPENVPWIDPIHKAPTG